ncbi:MAG: hypothetical protein QNL90_12275 [Gammaproteobacteria bacterium]|nr:hypothetical protein [Gammaproteobacteria bacterium]MDX2460891.1 hypothetical protein [Gammaproteobacteria bacterium]
MTAMLLVALGWFGCAGAATGKDKRFDSAAVPAAFPESEHADTSSLIAHMQRTLPADVSVISQGHWVIASSGSVEEATRQGLRIENYNQQMRRQISANPETAAQSSYSVRIALTFSVSPKRFTRDYPMHSYRLRDFITARTG